MEIDFESDLGSSIGSSIGTKSSGASGSATATLGTQGSVCVFRLAGAHYGIDVSCVGEVIIVDSVTKVPMAPAGVVGMTNLRGIALAVVDLAEVLGLPQAGERHEAGATPVLVLRFASGMTVGTRIDRVESIVAYGRDHLRLSQALAEHEAIAGILELPGANEGLLPALLDQAFLERRLGALKFTARSSS